MKKIISAWGNYPKIHSNVIKPTSFELPILNNICIPQGNLRSYGDSALFQDVINLSKQNKVIELNESKAIIECQAGILFSEILDLLIPKGFFLPVTPGTKFISLGGAIASDIHGKNHHKEGAFSTHLISFILLVSLK